MKVATLPHDRKVGRRSLLHLGRSQNLERKNVKQEPHNNLVRTMYRTVLEPCIVCAMLHSLHSLRLRDRIETSDDYPRNPGEK